MNYETYITNFKGREIPEGLDRLLQFKEDIDELTEELWVAGISFKFINDSDAWLTHWLGYESKITDCVLGIATNGAGDLIAFWLYDERELKDAPIVFIGHEGEVSVIANNFDESLLMLIVCSDLHPYTILDNDLEEDYSSDLADEIIPIMVADGTYPPNTVELLEARDAEIQSARKEFIEKLGLQPPKDIATLMQNAVQAHPDFEEWLNNQVSMERPDSFAD